MKIAIDIRSAGGEKAGKGWYTFHLVRELLALDRTNDYILYAENGVPGFESFKNAELRIIKPPLWHAKVALSVRKEKAHIYFAPTSFIVPTLLPKSIKTVITIHDLVAFLFPKNHNRKAVIVEKILLRKAIKNSAHICTASENTKKDVLDRFPDAKGKVSTIYCSAGENFHPVEKERLTQFARQTNLPQHFFLAVGTIEPRKNYPNLIKAFALLAEKLPDYHLIIVGKNGWNFEETHQQIKENYLQKKVHILGYLSEKSLIGLYNLATALVFPSFYEGFGIPPLEAMKSGCPVIASSVSSLPEVVGNAEILINPNKPEEIAAAMFRIVKNPKIADNMRIGGLIQAQKFSWTASAQKLLNIFETLKK